MGTKKTTKRLQESDVKEVRQKYRFELAPSRQPLKYKALWDLEDEISSVLSTAPITPLLPSTSHYTIPSSILMDSYYASYSNIFSIDYLWLNYSSYLNHVYSLRSIKCYVNIRNSEYLCDIYRDQIDKLYEDLFNYYVEVLGYEKRNIKNTLLTKACLWFVYHLNRACNNKSLGVRLSYSRNFYSEFQGGEFCVSGSVVQNLIDFMEHSGIGYIFKGYNLKDNVVKGKGGAVSYSGNTSSAMTLLLFRGQCVMKYCSVKPLDNKEIRNMSTTGLSDKQSVEVRVKSKCKDVIPKEDYPMEWLDRIDMSERVMSELNNTLQNSVISIGEYEILEKFFRRIWIGDLDYGRVHDSGEWQSKSKALRSQVLIDGVKTKTADISSLHPRMLYTLEGIELPEGFDPYPALDMNLDVKRIKKFKNFYKLKSYNPKRSLAKVVLLILLNAKSLHEAKEAIKGKLKKDCRKGMTYNECYMDYVGVPPDVDVDNIIQQVVDHNKPIAKYFATGASSMLMSKDGDIIVDAIDMLTQISVVCLPLHDSVTVREEYIGEAVTALEYGYRRVMGSLMNFKCDIE